MPLYLEISELVVAVNTMSRPQPEGTHYHRSPICVDDLVLARADLRGLSSSRCGVAWIKYTFLEGHHGLLEGSKGRDGGGSGITSRLRRCT